MAGSEAEERIRAKVEYALRQEFPDARIIHELKMEMGIVRLDLAAVRPNAITLVEIKSERDVLKRLGSQVSAAAKITGDVRVYITEKHRAAVTLRLDQHERDGDGRTRLVWTTDEKTGRQQGRYVDNPLYLKELGQAFIAVETEAGFEALVAMHHSWWPRHRMTHLADPRAQLEMLWAEELRAITGGHSRLARAAMKQLALETLTGSQIRAAVCGALRGRTFARADCEAA